MRSDPCTQLPPSLLSSLAALPDLPFEVLWQHLASRDQQQLYAVNTTIRGKATALIRRLTIRVDEDDPKQAARLHFLPADVELKLPETKHLRLTITGLPILAGKQGSPHGEELQPVQILSSDALCAFLAATHHEGRSRCILSHVDELTVAGAALDARVARKLAIALPRNMLLHSLVLRQCHIPLEVLCPPRRLFLLIPSAFQLVHLTVENCIGHRGRGGKGVLLEIFARLPLLESLATDSSMGELDAVDMEKLARLCPRLSCLELPWFTLSGSALGAVLDNMLLLRTLSIGSVCDSVDLRGRQGGMLENLHLGAALIPLNDLGWLPLRVVTGVLQFDGILYISDTMTMEGVQRAVNSLLECPCSEAILAVKHIRADPCWSQLSSECIRALSPISRFFTSIQVDMCDFDTLPVLQEVFGGTVEQISSDSPQVLTEILHLFPQLTHVDLDLNHLDTSSWPSSGAIRKTCQSHPWLGQVSLFATDKLARDISLELAGVLKRYVEVVTAYDPYEGKWELV